MITGRETIFAGQRVQLSAGWVNRVNRMLAAFDSGGVTGSQTPLALRNDVVRFRNTTLANVAAGDVVGLYGADFDYTTWSNESMLIGRNPVAADAGRFGVVRRGAIHVPGDTGYVGTAVLDGVTLARVRMQREHHRFAEIESGKRTLRSVPIGSAAILWVQPVSARAAAQGDEEQTAWAVIRLAAPQPAVEYRVTGYGTGLNDVENSSLRAVPSDRYEDGSPAPEDVEDIYVSTYSGNDLDPEEIDITLCQPALRVGSRFPVVAREYYGEVRPCCLWPLMRECDPEES